MSEWIRHNSSTSKFPSIHSIIWPTASPASEGLSDWTRFLNKPEIKNHSRFEFLTKMISTGDFSVSLEIPGLVLVQKFLRHYSDGWTYIKFKHFLSLWQSDVSGSNVKMNRNIYLKFLIQSNHIWSRRTTKQFDYTKCLFSSQGICNTNFVSRFKIDS